MIASTSSNRLSRFAVRAAAVLLVACLPGCGDNSYPADLTYPIRTDLLVIQPSNLEDFYPDPPGHLDESIKEMVKRSGGKPEEFALDPSTVDAGKKQQLAAALNEVFGTPAAPTLKVKDGHPEKEAIEAGLKEIFDIQDVAEVGKRLAAGSKVYRRQCLQCHGVTGDGRGPTGAWVHPHPRDYRKGEFKFISSTIPSGKRKPRREDLMRLLNKGIEGTSMPSFALLPRQDLEDVMAYVMHLSIRGQIEYDSLRKIIKQESLLGLDGDESDTATIETMVPGMLKSVVVDQWAASNKSLIKAEPPKFKIDDETERLAAVKRGYELFVSNKQEFPCIGCHKDFGRQVNFSYDKWGTRVRPANLTLGVYRGGRRPIDLFWRIRGGIAPSNMSGIGDVIKDDQIWDVVYFLQSVPYPAMLPEDIRHKIYGKPPEVGDPETKGGHKEH